MQKNFLICSLLFLLSSSTFVAHRRLHAQTSNDVTMYIENLGAPAGTRYSDPEALYARTIWDMEVFHNRLYLGTGNANNVGTAVNAGPVNLYYFDNATGQVASDGMIDEEQIHKFNIIDDTLFIPGTDPRSTSQGIYYYWNRDGVWEREYVLAEPYHLYDIHYFQGKWYVALGGDGNGEVVAVRANEQYDWTYISISQAWGNAIIQPIRAYELFEISGNLYVSIHPNSVLVPRLQGGVDVQWMPVSVQQLTADNRFVGVDFAGELLLPNMDFSIPVRIVRPVEFQQNTVYITATRLLDHDWLPVELFNIDSSLNPRRIEVGSAKPFDLLIKDSTLYVLLFETGDRAATISVRATCDLETWREVLHFEFSTFIRSFALYDGDFYFGAGTLPDPVSPATGELIRVTNDYFTTGC